MMMFNHANSRLGLLLAAITLAVDQFHKWWMIEVFRIGERGRVEITPFFDLIMVWNKGVSYGLLKQDSDAGRWALIAFALILVVILAVWLSRMSERSEALAIGLIIGGALGNVIDRVNYGAVADFFRFHAGGVSWYVFNIADVAIVAGVAALLYASLKSSHKNAGNQI